MRTFKHLLCLFLVVALAGCASQKNVLYLQDLTEKDALPIKGTYDMKITCDDLLRISVGSRTPELVIPFMNQTGAIFSEVADITDASEGSVKQNGVEYLVDSNGDIDFPILGKLHVVGMTRMELMDYIKARLINEDLIKDASVSVNILNFKVAVLGEVGSPGVQKVNSERFTIFEALSKAGDLKLTGRREHVTVVREENGQRIPYYVDLRSKDVFKSPCYYLQQNDLVYVEPNKAAARQSNTNEFKRVTTWTSLASFVASMVTIICVSD